MKYPKAITCILILFTSSFLCGCGNGSGPNPGTSASNQMGGAIQNKELVLNGTVLTLAGSLSATPGWTDGVGVNAKFCLPYDITSDGTNLYVADTGNNTIRKIVISTGAVSILAGKIGIPGTLDGIGTDATFVNPTGITTDGKYLFVTQPCMVRKILISTGTVTTLAGGTLGSTDGIGTQASFSHDLGGITTDGVNLFVTDSSNATIRKIIISTGEVSTLAGSAGIWWLANDGIGAAARFQDPEGITTDGTNIYVADANNTIRKITISNKEVTTLTGIPTHYFDVYGGAAGFKRITTDGINLYVTSTDTNTIQKLVISTGKMTTLVGSKGNSGFIDGIGSDARFNYPVGITTDGKNLFVADSINNSIRRVF